MIDAHVHLENGPLSKDYVFEFIKVPKRKESTICRFWIIHIVSLNLKKYMKTFAKIPAQKEWF